MFMCCRFLAMKWLWRLIKNVRTFFKHNLYLSQRRYMGLKLDQGSCLEKHEERLEPMFAILVLTSSLGPALLRFQVAVFHRSCFKSSSAPQPPPSPPSLGVSTNNPLLTTFLLLYNTVFPRVLWHFIKAARRWYCPLSKSEINSTFIASGNGRATVKTFDGFSQLQDLWSILYLHLHWSLISYMRHLLPLLCPFISLFIRTDIFFAQIF